MALFAHVPIVPSSKCYATGALMSPTRSFLHQTLQRLTAALGLHCRLHRHVDFVTCLGGDGVVLHASSLFQRAMPPVSHHTLATENDIPTCSPSGPLPMASAAAKPLLRSTGLQLTCFFG